MAADSRELDIACESDTYSTAAASRHLTVTGSSRSLTVDLLE